MTDPDAVHYAAPATQCTGCGLRRDGRRAVTRDSTRVSCPECQEVLARQAERRLRGPPPIGDPSYAGATATRQDVERAAAFVAPWAAGIRVKAGANLGVVVVILSVAEDLEYYQDHAHLVAKRLSLALPAGLVTKVEVELAEAPGD